MQNSVTPIHTCAANTSQTGLLFSVECDVNYALWLWYKNHKMGCCECDVVSCVGVKDGMPVTMWVNVV